MKSNREESINKVIDDVMKIDTVIKVIRGKHRYIVIISYNEKQNLHYQRLYVWNHETEKYVLKKTLKYYCNNLCKIMFNIEEIIEIYDNENNLN